MLFNGKSAENAPTRYVFLPLLSFAQSPPMLASSALTPTPSTALVLTQVQSVTGNPHDLLCAISYDQVSVTIYLEKQPIKQHF